VAKLWKISKLTHILQPIPAIFAIIIGRVPHHTKPMERVVISVNVGGPTGTLDSRTRVGYVALGNR